MPEIEYDEDGKIKRRFTPEWEESGELDIDDLLPKLAIVAVTQISNLVNYIEELHNEIDRLNQKLEEKS